MRGTVGEQRSHSERTHVPVKEMGMNLQAEEPLRVARQGNDMTGFVLKEDFWQLWQGWSETGDNLGKPLLLSREEEAMRSSSSDERG